MANTRRVFTALLILLTTLLLTPTAVAQTATTTRYDGTLPNGATWIADVPADWNGTVLLYSHGYNPFPDNPPQNAPDGATADALLDRGYALAGSSFSRSGWALETAADDQLDTLHAVTDLIGPPQNTIAVGTSMGGLVTGQLAERAGDDIHGALATCGLMSGGIDLHNYQLDGAHAIGQLLLPDEELRLVDFDSADQAALSAQRMTEALDEAQATPEGRARVALVTALFMEPGWAPGQPKPEPGDHQAHQAGQYENLRSVLLFVTSGRHDVEQTAGGNPSWNVGVNYRRLLAESGRLQMVRHLYRQAGADLDADLALLTETADVTPDQSAHQWMEQTSVLGGDLDVPVLTLHTTDDGLVPVEHERAYADTVRAAGADPLLRQAYTDTTGHCAFTPAELVAAVETVQERVETGGWGDSTTPWRLQARAESLDLGPAAYLPFRPGGFTGDRPLPVE